MRARNLILGAIVGMTTVIVGYGVAVLIDIPWQWSLFVTYPLAFLFGVVIGLRPSR